MSAQATATDRERAQLVRELHDQVTHAVSQIHVHAGALQTPGATDAGASIDAIRVACRAAMHDLRRMHAVIDGEAVVPYRPQPDLQALRELLDGVRHDGDGVCLETAPAVDGDGAGPVIPGSVAATAYRVARDVLDQLHAQPGAGLTGARIAVAGGVLRLDLSLRWTAPRSPRAQLDLRRARVRTHMLDGTLRLRRDAGSGADADRWTVRLTLPLGDPA